MGITRPTGEQLRFRSQNTGDHVLDTYLEASEKGGRALTDLLDDLFDDSGVFRAANFEFQFDPSVDKIQFRAGNFASPSAGWTDITTFFNITGTFNAATTYQNFDLATTSDKDVYIVHGLSSGSTFANEAAFIASSNTTRIVDVSEARDWAKKTDGIVDSTDYSSKAWAVGGTGVTNSATGGAAKEWAIKTSGTVDGTNYSAKYWATSTDVVTVSTNIADVTTVATDISNVNTVSTSISSVNTTSSNIADVNTVAAEIGVGQDVTVVAADLSGTDTIGTAATNIANINTTAGSIANVNTVAGSITNVNTVSGSIANVNTVAPYVGAGNDITVVAAQITNNNLQTIAADIAAVITTANDLNEAVSEIDTVANAIANVDTVGINIASVNTVSTNIANVNTVGTDISNVNTVATNLGAGNDVTVVAANIADVNTVAGISADVTTAATNSVQFNNTYLGAQSSAPTLDPDGSALDLGDLYFDTTTSTMKVYSASGWINAGSSVNGTADRFTYTATAAQTTFTGNDDNTNSLAYDAGFLDVYMNGVKLVNGSDFTATNGTSIVLASAAAANDTIEIIAYGTFVLADHLTETQSDAKYVEVAGDTMTGNLGIGISPVTHNGNAKTLHVDGGANASELRLTNTTTGSASANGFHIAQVGNTSYVVQNENAPLNFYTNGAYAAQFDASGNLLVGKTSSAFGTEGVEVRPDALWVTRDSDTPVFFNRETTDGQILNFSKDTGTVGSIGTKSSGLFIGSDDAGIFFNDHGGGDLDAIYPYDVGTNTFYNGHVDIGGASNRFKDLHLSGTANVNTVALGVNPTVTFQSNYLRFQTATASVPVVELLASASGNYSPRFDIFNGQGNLYSRFDAAGGTVFNEQGEDLDFRVESNNNSNMLVVDAGDDAIGFGGGAIAGVITNTRNGSNVGNNVGDYKYLNRLHNDTNNNTNYLYTMHYRSGAGTDWTGSGMRIQRKIDASWMGYVNFNSYGVSIGSGVDTTNPNGSGIDECINFFSTGTTVNDNGEDHDFRVESDNTAYALFVEGSSGLVGVGNNSPVSLGNASTYGITVGNGGGSGRVHINANGGGAMFSGTDTANSPTAGFKIGHLNGTNRIEMEVGTTRILDMFQTAVAFNNGGVDMDFRIESDSNSYALFVDASHSSTVCFGTNNINLHNSNTAGVNIGGNGNLGQIIASSYENRPLILHRGGNNGQIIEFGAQTSTVGSIDVTTSGTTYNTTSDRRLKTDIEPIEHATDMLMAMNPVSHRWKLDPDGDAVVGFIAQEMQEIVPEAVSGDPDGEEMMSMDYGRITPVLVAALQDAHKKIEALEERLAELEAK